MTAVKSKSAQSVQDVLDGKGLTCEVLELSESTRTAQDASNTIGCDVRQIVKSLVFVTKETRTPVLVLASGPNRVDEKLIASHVGEAISKADADFVRRVTGFAIGGIPPVGHKAPIDLVFVDQDLLSFEEVWAAAGTPRAVFKIRSSDLQSISNGRVISVA